MLKRIVCALGAFCMLMSLVPGVRAEDATAIVEMPAVVTPIEPSASQDTAENMSGGETDGEASEESAEDLEDAEPSGLAALFDEFRAAHGLTQDNFAVSYYDTVTGESYDWNETHMMVAASTYKLPLNLYYYELENAGQIASDALITEGGATLDRCHYLSIVESNNEISHALLYRIGTFRDYKDAMRKYFTMTDDEIDPKYYQNNYYCTRMMMDTLKYIYPRQEEFAELLDYMKQAHPQNGYFKAKVTEMEIAHKYGSFEGAENDVGIFYAEHPFLLAVYTQNVGEGIVQDAARLAADYNAQQTELCKQQELQEKLDAFEAEKQVRMAQAEQLAQDAKKALAAQAQSQQAAQILSSSAEDASAGVPEAETAQPAVSNKASSAFRFDPANFEWWMIAVALGVLAVGGGGILLILRTGKMKDMTRDEEAKEQDSSDGAESACVPSQPDAPEIHK